MSLRTSGFVVSGLAAMLAVLVLAGSAAAIPTESSPWGQTGFNGADTRANKTENQLTLANINKVKYLRSVVAPPSGPHNICYAGATQPVLVGQILYAVVGDGVSAYTASTGKRLWHTVVDTDQTTFYVGLGVSGGLVIVGEEDCLSQSDPTGVVQALNAKTGKQVWRAFMGPEGGPLLAMVISHNLVVTNGGSAGGGQPTVVRRVATGAVVWRHDAAEGLCDFDPALVVHSLVLYNNCDSSPKLVAARISDGHVMWTKKGVWYPERGDTDTDFALHLYARSASGAVVDINPTTGATRLTLSGATHTVAVDGSRVYAACGTASLCAYARSTGARVWRDDDPELTERPTLGLNQAAIGGALLFLVNGTVLNAKTGAELRTLSAYDSSDRDMIAVGDGRIAITNSVRVIDLFGSPGR